MSKYLTAKEFCEIVLDKKRKLPKEINILRRKKKALTRLFGWFETIRNCNSYNQFKAITKKSNTCEKIEKMEVTEKELLSLLSLWDLWRQMPDQAFEE